jgi:hypothetical protein
MAGDLRRGMMLPHQGSRLLQAVSSIGDDDFPGANVSDVHRILR